MDIHLHRLEGKELAGLKDTLQRINDVAGYGQVAALEQDTQEARIERPHVTPTLRKYTLMKDWNGRLVVRFCGRTRIVKIPDGLS